MIFMQRLRCLRFRVGGLPSGRRRRFWTLARNHRRAEMECTPRREVGSHRSYLELRASFPGVLVGFIRIALVLGPCPSRRSADEPQTHNDGAYSTNSSQALSVHWKAALLHRKTFVRARFTRSGAVGA